MHSQTPSRRVRRLAGPGLFAAAAITLGGLSAGTAFAQTATAPNYWGDFVSWFNSTNEETGARPTPEAMAAKIMDMMKDVDITSMNFSEIQSVNRLARYAPELQTALSARMDELAKSPTLEGARVKVMQMSSGPLGDDAAEKVGALMKHPAFNELMKTDAASSVFGMLGSLPKEAATGMKDTIMGLAPMMDRPMTAADAGVASAFIGMMKDLGDVIPADFRNTTRTKVVDRLKTAAAAMPEGDAGNERLMKTVAYLDGAYMRGELVDHAAPNFTFNWSSGDTNLKGLEDLKGKVVVLDFWATWCGPCIASIPNVAKLQEHYNGYDVEIIGVTSLQGTHYGHDGNRIDCEGDPAKEYSLMPGFMEAKGITWTVAFSTEDVFNPDYGVRGIPHVAIIDPEGVLRYRGMHPANSLAEKAEKIDGLLKKAGLPAPAPVAREDGTAAGE